jgi:hypothetical protein
MNKQETKVSRRQMLGTVGGLGGVVLTLGAGSLFAQAKLKPSDVLSEKVVAANRELDRVFLEGHRLKDSQMIRTTFSKSQDVFFIEPSGVLHKGRENIGISVQNWFDTLDYVTGEIKDISYIPVGQGVIALGNVVFSRRPKNGRDEKKYVIWTDYRVLENKKWVYLFRHAHWPVDLNPPAAKS